MIDISNMSATRYEELKTELDIMLDDDNVSELDVDKVAVLMTEYMQYHEAYQDYKAKNAIN